MITTARDDMKKIIVVALSFIMMFQTTTYCFAANNLEDTSINSLRESIIRDYGSVVADENIGIVLPEEFSNYSAMISEQGISYSKFMGSSGFELKVKNIEDNGIDAFSLVGKLTLKNRFAKSNYTFDYALPNGYTIKEDYQVSDAFDASDCGNLLILNRQGEVISTVEPLSAVDAGGKTVKVKREISGDIVTYSILVDSDTIFPVVASTTTHPDIYETKKLTRSEVLDVRNNYSGTVVGVVGKILGFIPLGLGSYVWHMISFNADNYYTKNYETWDNIYTSFPVSWATYACVKFRYRWHQGHKSYYPSGNLSCTYE